MISLCHKYPPTPSYFSLSLSLLYALPILKFPALWKPDSTLFHITCCTWRCPGQHFLLATLHTQLRQQQAWWGWSNGIYYVTFLWPKFAFFILARGYDMYKVARRGGPCTKSLVWICRYLGGSTRSPRLDRLCTLHFNSSLSTQSSSREWLLVASVLVRLAFVFNVKIDVPLHLTFTPPLPHPSLALFFILYLPYPDTCV